MNYDHLTFLELVKQEISQNQNKNPTIHAWKSIWPYLRQRTKPQNHRPRAGPESIPTGTMRGRVPSCGKSVNQEAWQVGALQPCRKWFIPSTKHSSVVTTYSFGMWFEIWLMPILMSFGAFLFQNKNPTT